jgi:uncharacterized membrane protein
MSLVPSITLDRHKSGSMHILVVGLAGAAMCMTLQKYFPLARLTIVDLDATVQERIARYIVLFTIYDMTSVNVGCRYMKYCELNCHISFGNDRIGDILDSNQAKRQ